MKLNFASLALLIVAAVTIPLGANAATVTYTLNLNGAQQVPANASPAVGSAELTIDDVANTASFLLVGLSLTGEAVAAHIHMAPAGQNGGVVFNLFANADSNEAIFGLANTIALIGEDKALDDGLGAMINATPWKFYINLHTTEFPGGEIRGQLAPVPLPPALWLFGAAAAGLGALRRRNA